MWNSVMEPEIFQGRRFLGIERLQHFIYNTSKNVDTLKTAFEWQNLTHIWTQLGHIFPQKSSRLHSSPLAASLKLVFSNVMEKHKLFCVIKMKLEITLKLVLGQLSQGKWPKPKTNRNASPNREQFSLVATVWYLWNC